MRGFVPAPGAFFEADLGARLERVKMLQTGVEPGESVPGEALDGEGLIACGEGALRLRRVQRAGKGPMGFAEFSRGRRGWGGARGGGHRGQSPKRDTCRVRNAAIDLPLGRG